MSNKVNHRRKGQRRRSENATFSGPPCGAPKHKAKGRRKWKARGNRSLRRNGYRSMKVHGFSPVEPVQFALDEAQVRHTFPASRVRLRKGYNLGRWRVEQRKLARSMRKKRWRTRQ